ncbi:PREDICTED: threonylcarbamoyladenosine tRNA methylthiotransferase [Dinoponera quadriceps]|uniref:tRNA-t(6)A37 methylthiotransferase n=1 Tax=Dinoponera quadriceps TaxID=609295 RepID=A0A6P3YEB0_DINQU|nr:PREDICTED: threonylcarbamoyladenosine tRNA methylthiotransferase [Dinoponera quadriceps]
MPSLCDTDIEDFGELITSLELVPKVSKHSKDVRIRRILRKQESQQAPEPSILSSIIPGTQTIYVKTWGCTHNSSDTEYMAGQLAAQGYNLTDDKLKANLWILNSCTVKSPAEDQFRNEIGNGKKLGKHIVVTGCVPQGAPKSSFLKGLSMIGVQQIDRVVEVVEETLKGHTVRFLQTKKNSTGKKIGGSTLDLPKIRKNPLIEIIAISTGCLNQCTYCKTRHARGQLGSYPPEEIIARAVRAFEEDVRELWITSEDTGAYGRDIGTNLPELLWRLIDVIPENCMMRIGMTNPPYILEHLDEMAKILKHPRVYSFLHIPVQSGSDQVLADMKREYTRADFEHVVNYLRERVPDLTIATDIICGFPSETEEDFEETLTLCRKYKFPSLFINQFFPRPGTPAARMPRVPTQQVKARTKKLTELFYSYEPYEEEVGKLCHVLVTEVAHDKLHYVGHNKFYGQVLLPKREEYMGTMILVRITEATKFSMKGEHVKEHPPKSRIFPLSFPPPSRRILKVSGEPCETKPPRHVTATLLTIFLAVMLRMLWKCLHYYELF